MFGFLVVSMLLALASTRVLGRVRWTFFYSLNNLFPQIALAMGFLLQAGG